jgi:linoleoyl-CoA desaturase
MQKVTFNNKYSPFFDALKEKVDVYFKSNNIKKTGNYKLYIKTITLAFSAIAIYSMLVFFTPPVWISVILCCMFGLTLAGIGFNVMHDGAHGSYSTKKWVNNFSAYTLNMMGGSSYLWKIKHNINHHTFTNIEGMDSDIDIKFWMRLHKEQKFHWFHKFQYIYFFFFYGISYLMWVYYLDFVKYFSSKVSETSLRKMSFKDHVSFWFSKIIYTGFFIVLPIFMVGLIPTIVGYSIIVFVCGLTISIVFQLAHVVEATNFPKPDEDSGKIDSEWAIHQVITTADFATKNKVISWFVGGLNFQVVHHLFPKVSHVHYPNIIKIIRETCIQFNVPYKEYPTFLSAVRSHIHQLKELGIN